MTLTLTASLLLAYVVVAVAQEASVERDVDGNLLLTAGRGANVLLVSTGQNTGASTVATRDHVGELENLLTDKVNKLETSLVDRLTASDAAFKQLHTKVDAQAERIAALEAGTVGPAVALKEQVRSRCTVAAVSGALSTAIKRHHAHWSSAIHIVCVFPG